MKNKFESARHFTVDDEYPLRPEQAGAYKTETYNQWVYDPVQDIGLNIWYASSDGVFPNFMSTVIVFIKGETFVAKSQGDGNHANGVAAGNALLTIVEPFKHLQIEFLGLLRRNDGKSDPFAANSDGERLLSRMNLRVDIVSPAIEQGTEGDRGEVASSGTVPRTALRYEQLCRISGPIEIGNRRIELNALGMRSHRRNSASIYASGAVGHTWVSGLFPSGHGFNFTTYMVQPDAELSSVSCHYFDGKIYHDAELLQFPYYSGATGKEQSTLAMRVNGKVLEVKIESLPPLLGIIPPQGVRLSRSAARFTLNGEVGGGVLERSLMPQFQGNRDYIASAR